MKKRKINSALYRSAVLLMILLVAAFVNACSSGSGSDAVGKYEVILPEGYENSDQEYAVIYVMPQDGYSVDDSGLAEKLQESFVEGGEMIIVKPSFGSRTEVCDSMKALTEEIDATYRTMEGKTYRALAGTGVGGYLSYIVGMNETMTFSVMASIRGDFVSEENSWYETYGDVYDQIEKNGNTAMEKFYTYMDAPVEDEWTDMEGSTDDLGALFIEFGTSSEAHEFTVRPGEFTEEFFLESAKRLANRLTKTMLPNVDLGEEDVAVDSGSEESIDPSYPQIDLTGDWYFKYVGKYGTYDAAELTKEEYETWSVVQPGKGNWTKGYGNINDDTVKSSYGADYFDYFIVGSGYYVRTFEVPADFEKEELYLAIGYIDDRCEVFLNGERVGATGMDENGRTTGETTWAEYSEFLIDANLLNYGGENTVIVRAWNDEPYGAGGWYSGPISLYSKLNGDSETEVSNEELRFYEETFESQYAATALGQIEPVENEYLIYLPEGYYESERYYPTVYLLHQFNSKHTSYKVDKVDQLLDEGIASGVFDEMIVVIPNSDENSWWTGNWEKMVTEELIPLIDEKYRTIDDARYRLTAGCSMGGQGAYGVALHNPDYFSGAVSFYGAFSYGEENSPNVIAAKESAEYMDYFSMYFICGNQDSYGFGVPAIELHQMLLEQGVEHRFFIENGGHDSAFYVPYFEDAFGYIRSEMYQSDEAIGDLLTAELKVDGTKVKVDFEAMDGIEAYFNTIPESSYTDETEQGLNIPIIVEVVQDGEVVYTSITRENVVNDEVNSAAITVDAAEYVDSSKEFSVQCKAAVFDRIVNLGSVGIN